LTQSETCCSPTRNIKVFTEKSITIPSPMKAVAFKTVARYSGPEGKTEGYYEIW